MEEQLRSLIAADEGVAELVSMAVHWRLAPQSASVPFVNLSVISGERDYHMTGPSGLVNSRVQVDCWSDKYSTAKALARAVETAVSGFSGAMGSITFNSIMIDAERDDDFPATGDTGTRFRVSLDLNIWHSKG
jgi:hypothetical protein